MQMNKWITPVIQNKQYFLKNPSQVSASDDM